MDSNSRKIMLKDRQVRKFYMYGFLKNLTFFKPYLIVFLMQQGLSLLEIGVLISIREIIINVFEVPSGMIADYFGRKKELYLCFSFYIASFAVFFFASSFTVAAVGMSLFGLGEAFRSGTHKAMIYTYIDKKSWQSEKTFLYGRIRSFSLIGSAVGSFVGIILMLLAPNIAYVFLFSMLPYVVDFLLIMSYPKFLDISDRKENESLGQMIVSFVKCLFKSSSLRRILWEDGLVEATVSYTKDIVQPILQTIVIGMGITVFAFLSGEDNLYIILGILHMVCNLMGAVASRKAYIIKGSNIKRINGIHVALAVVLGMLGIWAQNAWMVCILYVFIYVLHSARKPMFVEELDANIQKSQRATTLSVASQLKSLILIVFAPLFGFLVEHVGFEGVTLSLAGLLMIALPFVGLRKCVKSDVHKE